jgi:hypothetical protein
MPDTFVDRGISVTDESMVKVGVAAHQELLVAGIANLIDQSPRAKIVGRTTASRVSVLRRWMLETEPEVIVTADRLALTVLGEVSQLSQPPRVAVLATRIRPGAADSRRRPCGA